MYPMNETLKTIHSLRTIHGNFTSQEVKDEDVKTILEACVRSANASARQSYSVVVVKDRDLIKTLNGFVGNRALIFCIDYNRIIDTAKHLNHSFSANGIIQFVTGSTDTILAAQTAAIAAKSIGIDSMFTNGIHRGDVNRVYELLDLPKEYCFPLISLILGYPKKEPDHLKGRINGPGIIHHDRYQRLTTEELDQLVKEYDDPGNHMGLNEIWEKEGFNHYLDWFFKVWSARGDKPEGKSQVAEILENIGFRG